LGGAKKERVEVERAFCFFVSAALAAAVTDWACFFGVVKKLTQVQLLEIWARINPRY
jgi:hypothetical protein